MLLRASSRAAGSRWATAAREQLDRYLHRYLNFLGADVAALIAATAKMTSARALKDTVRTLADLGADELLLVPTTSDPDEVHRVADIIG